MKKVLRVFISVLCVFVMLFSESASVIYADDAEFENNYDYYCQLCSQRQLTNEQKITCQNFRRYMARQKAQLTSVINSYNSQLKSLKDNITIQYNKIQQINNQIASVEKQIAGIQKSIKNVEANIKQVEAEIQIREAKIEEINNNIKSYMQLNQANIVTNNYIKFVMGASSFVDLLRRVSAVNEITEYEVGKIREMEAEKALLEIDKAELEAHKVELKEQQESLTVYKNSLNSLKKVAEQLIAEYKAKSAALGAELAEQQADMSELKSKIIEVDKALDGFWPTDGWVTPLKSTFTVTSAFPYYEPGNSSSGFHPAADLAVANGSNVYAVGNGYVVKRNTGCGYGYLGSHCGGGFGNYVCYLIQVGNTIYLIINAHLSKVNVKVGDVVRQGTTVIGLSGSSGSSSGPHLHIETIRIGSGITMKTAINNYLKVGRVYYTLGRTVGYTCSYRGAPCYDNTLNIFGIKYGRRYSF